MNANYFSHDSNARNSEKIIKLRMRHKSAGYGVFFMILERLRESSNYMSVKDYNVIAFDLREDASLIKSVVEDFGLFVFTEDGKYFYSESFMKRMNLKDQVKEGRSLAGKKGMESRWKKQNDNNVITDVTENDNNVITDVTENDNKKEKKRKKSKVNNNPPLTPPEGEDEDEKNFVIERILDDGKKRNMQGLIEEMERLCIPKGQQNEILYLSNYGLIGHSVWPLIHQCVSSLSKSMFDPSKIKLPGNYIIKKLKEQQNESTSG